MNKKEKKKIENETFVLPSIIAERKVFLAMTKSERTLFYDSINSRIEDSQFKRGNSLWQKMLYDPEERLNKPFLEGLRKNPKIWKLYVSIFEECLYEHLPISLQIFQEKHKAFEIELNKAADRISALQESIDKYTPNTESNEDKES